MQESHFVAMVQVCFRPFSGVVLQSSPLGPVCRVPTQSPRSRCCMTGDDELNFKMAAVFKPIIRWAQSKERLFLTLELTDVQVGCLHQ